MKRPVDVAGVATIQCFACTLCKAPRRSRRDAEQCCRCRECQHKFPRDHFGSLCGHCSYGSQLREARKGVRREEDSLKDARKRLDALLAMKRPPKGSAVQ